jgi:hypothetical protein
MSMLVTHGCEPRPNKSLQPTAVPLRGGPPNER